MTTKTSKYRQQFGVGDLPRLPLWMDPCGPAAAGCELDLELACPGHRAGGLLVLAGSAIGIHAVLIRFESKTSLRQKRKINIEAALCPVIHCSDVPIASIPSGDQDVIGDARVEHLALVPLSGHCRKKLHYLRLAQVIGGGIGQHLQWPFIDNVHCELVAASSQSHRLIEKRSEGIFCGVAHRSRSVIQGTEKHSREGEEHVVFRL